MAYDYDALYADEKNALGAPFPEVVAFFETLEGGPVRVLDIGCGQGRDALFIARAGHCVVAVDLSPAGVADVAAAAMAEDLPITGVVADILTYKAEGRFEVLLIDRTLHMLEGDDQSRVLAGLLRHVVAGGWLLLADEKSNMPRFRDVLAGSDANWTITRDGKGFLFAQSA